MRTFSFVLVGLLAAAGVERPMSAEEPWQGWLVDASQVDAPWLSNLQRESAPQIVLSLSAATPDRKKTELAAARILHERFGRIGYWIEIGRCPELAEAHPEWMASVQGHGQWRRLFPRVGPVGSSEIVKAFPWVPILYAEAFDAHVKRVERLLADMPAPRIVFLNDLQAAPSACGCGNLQCRWTTDYGPKRTATPAGSDAAARFCAAIAQRYPSAEIIPVWTTECEEHDTRPEGKCAGVGCFNGRCWRDSLEQFAPLAAQRERIGVLLTTAVFERESQPRPAPAVPYEGEGGWAAHALDLLATMPRRYGHPAPAPRRLVAVLQGWDSDPDRWKGEQSRVLQAGVGGVLVARTKIEQSWEPRVVPYMEKK